MSEDSLIQKAEFNPKVCTYWLLSGALILILTLFGIPLLLLWFPIGYVFTRRYLAAMECLLTEKTLKVKKGIFVRIEKTIPLEKITDMGMAQGPIMRHFDLYKLTIETAGQSGQGALVSLTGIKDAKLFRETVLKQREEHSRARRVTGSDSSQLKTMATDPLLAEIRDSLLRIESSLQGASSTESGKPGG